MGYPTETSDLIDFCRLKGIALIEDASHCHGAKIDNDYVGTQGDIGIFSTQERKLIGTGEGGIMLTNDEYLSARIQEVRNFGKPIRKELIQQGLEDQYGHLFGLNYRLSAFSAAIGIAQIDKLEEKIGLRTENAEFIKKGIDKRYFQEIPILINSRPNHYSIVLNFDHPTLNAEELGKQLSFNGIISDTYRFKYKPLYELPIFERYESICINASALSRKIITLPTHEGLTKEELNYIVETVNKLVS